MTRQRTLVMNGGYEKCWNCKRRSSFWPYDHETGTNRCPVCNAPRKSDLGKFWRAVPQDGEKQ